MATRIKPLPNNGAILLRFSVAGKRYSVSPGGRFDDPEALRHAQALAATIQADILWGRFDATLRAYKPTVPGSDRLLTVWDAWVKSLRLPEQTEAATYRTIRRQIARSNPEALETGWFTSAALAPATYNGRLSRLKAMARWGVGTGLLPEDPWADLKPRKSRPTGPKPFTRDEARAIVQALRSRSEPYARLAAFMFATGGRTGEALGVL